MKKKIPLLLSCFLLVTVIVQAAPVIHTGLTNPLQTRMLSDIAFIEESFEVKYAPGKWKNQFCGWTLKAAVAKVRNGILANPKITLKDYQRNFDDFNGTHHTCTKPAWL